MEKNLALGNDGFCQPALRRSPEPPMWNQQAQNILVFRPIICQTHKLAAPIALSGTRWDNSCSKMFKFLSKLFSTGLFSLL